MNELESFLPQMTETLTTNNSLGIQIGDKFLSSLHGTVLVYDCMLDGKLEFTNYGGDIPIGGGHLILKKILKRL